MRTQTQVCTFCDGSGFVQILQQTDDGPKVIVKDCPSCHETSGPGEPLVFHFFDPTQSANGRDGAGAGRTDGTETPNPGRENVVLEPDEVIKAPEMQLVDDHMEFHLMHVARKTAAKQAILLAGVYRQKQLDSFRADLAMKMQNELVARAAERMQQLWDYMESCTAHHSPEVATRIEALTLKGMEFHERLAEAAPGHSSAAIGR